MAANVENQTRALITERKKFHLRLSRRKILTFQQDKRKVVITEGAKGEHTLRLCSYWKWKENWNSSEEISNKEPVNQVVEVGTPVTHVGDEEGSAPVADAKPRVVIEDEEIPFTTITRETDAFT